MDDQKAARNDLADARRTIAELREDLNQAQTYMMHKTDEYSASLDRYRGELARSRETIHCLVVAFRVVWCALMGVGVLHGVSPKRLIAEVKVGIRLVENTLSEQFLIDIDKQLRAEQTKQTEE